MPLQAGDLLQLDLQGVSGGFGTLADSYLHLFNASGTQVAYDDDSGGGNNSRLWYTVPATGDYFIAADSYGSNVGTYTLTANVTGARVSPVGTLTGSSYDLQSGVVSAVLAGSAALVKTGSGTVTLTSANTFTGGTTITAGTLQLNASTGNAIVGNVVVGNGSAAAGLDLLQSNQLPDSSTLTVNAGGNVALGAASDSISTLAGQGTVTTTSGLLTVTGALGSGLTVGNLALASTATYSLTSDLTGSGSANPIHVLGTVDLGRSLLNFQASGTAAVGQTITILSNDGSSPVVGTFRGLAEGGAFRANNGEAFAITYSGGDGNDVVITRIDPVAVVPQISITPAIQTYTGYGQTLLASGTVLGGGIDLSSGLSIGATTQSEAGSYAVSWTFTSSDPRYSDASGTVVNTIQQAQATVYNLYGGIYNGLEQRAYGYAYGPAGQWLGYVYSNQTHTNAGTYDDSWSYTSTNPNYADSTGSASVTIEQAYPYVSVNPYTVTYDGQSHAATGTVAGVGGVDLTSGLTLNAAHVNAGSYSDSWSFHDSSNNYYDLSGTLANTINKASATITVAPYNLAYDGRSHLPTGTAIGVGGEDLSAGLMFAATGANTEPGSYTDHWQFISPRGPRPTP